MHPQIRLPRPGRCPICGMTLIRATQLASEQARIEQTAGLQTTKIVPRELFKELRTVGKIDYNERAVAYLTARVAGRVDRVYADFVGIRVKKGEHLVDIYSPDLYSGQSELLRALENADRPTGDRAFYARELEAARTRLGLLGILPEQIKEIEAARRVSTHLRIYAPIGGVIVEKNIRDQQYVEPGDMLYRIAVLDPVWLYLDIYESDLAWVQYGEAVDVTVEAYPGEKFRGQIMFIDPFLNDATRTVKVRVNLKNPDQRLKPAMYATATIHVRLLADGSPQPTGLEGKYICPMHPEIVRGDAGKCPICEMTLEQVPPRRKPISGDVAERSKPGEGASGLPQVLAIPKSAVLNTGRRQITYRRRDGAFELVDLTLGPLTESKEAEGRVASFYPVLSGLSEGDEVVVQGGFLLDSQRQIEGMPSLLYPEGIQAAIHAGHSGHAPAATESNPPHAGHSDP
ncbi:MAG: efflux RND transporter periplasmic adaptor subunit [Pirellulales bacterium]|nr:efflux RND transporter periplasmic adaptor subunit [Pirellulales bacterium]